jgi:putative hemolysin
MDSYLFIFLSLLSLYFSYEFTLIENAFWGLGSVKLEKLEDLQVENLDYIKKIHKDKNLYSTTLILDYFSNSLCIVFLTLAFYELFGYVGIPIGILVSTIIVIIFGQTLPRTMGKVNYEKSSLKKLRR